MAKRGENDKAKLNRKIFLYLLAISSLSAIFTGFFWIRSLINSYNEEVTLLKKTYSETRRLEIKNKILQIKDYIEWAQFNSENLIKLELSRQIDKLSFSGTRNVYDNNFFHGSFFKSLNDSLTVLRVPLYLIDEKGSVIFSYNPFTKQKYFALSSEEASLLEQIKKKKNEDQGSATLYNKTTGGDSSLTCAGYFNCRIIPGLMAVSVVKSDCFDKVLQGYLLDSISHLRYNENEYFFINTLDGKALISNGKFNKPPVDIFASGDTAWINIFKVEQTSRYQPDGVFYSYNWIKLASERPSKKTSYFSYIPAWECIIGTGFHEDDVNAVIELKDKELNNEARSALLKIVFYLIVSFLLCYFLVWILSKKLAKNLELFKTFFDRAAKENHLIDESRVNYREFSFMAEAANIMVKERKEIEEALKESEAHYRYLFEQNPLPLLIYELGSYKILNVNEAFINHYGYSKEEALHMRLTDLSPEDEVKNLLAMSKEIKGLRYSGEWHHKKKDGTQIIAEVNSHGFLYEGRSARIVVINDITEKKKIEKEILTLNANLEKKVRERTALLESANKELESFSNSVSHDLRAPLRHINGFLELFSKTGLDMIDEKNKHYIKSIITASGNMGVLIDNLLNFSRTGRMEMKVDYIDMNKVVREAISFLDQETSGRSIEWNVSDLPDVYADYAMIKQVWVNLLSNAVKYTRRKPVAIIEIGCRTESGENIFFVRDNGTGFDMTYVDKLFGVFQRLHSAEEFEGTGIGLANVRQVVKRHGGRTWAEGEVNKGATFYFSLPATKSDKNPQP